MSENTYDKRIKVFMFEDRMDQIAEFKKYCDESDDLSFEGHTDINQTAINMIEIIQPDVIILDLVTPHGDGFELADQICGLNLAVDPYIIVTTAFDRQEIYDMVHNNKKLGYVFVKGRENGYGPRRVFAHIRRVKESGGLSGWTAVEAAKEALANTVEMTEQRIRNLLSNKLSLINIDSAVAGRACIIEAVLIIIKAGERLPMKNVYADVEDICHCAAEEGIRRAIMRAWEKTDPKVLERVYTGPTNGKNGVPTSASFIYHLADQFSGGYVV